MSNVILTEAALNSEIKDTAEYIIYGHKCIITEKWYVGETKNIDDPEQRFGKNGSRYIKKTKTGKYNHPKFANAILKYGWDNFEHYILDYATEETVDEKEIFWIDEKNALLNGYNTTHGGKHSHKLTDENKAKISNPVIMKDLNNNFLMEFKSAKDAAVFLGIYNNSPIIECCKGYRKTTKGYIWEYKNGKSIREENIKTKKIVLQGYHTRTKVLQIDPKTNNIVNEFDSAITAEKETGINASCIYRCCRHERISTGGYKWEYAIEEEQK